MRIGDGSTSCRSPKVNPRWMYMVSLRVASNCVGFVLSMIIIVLFKVKLLEVNFRVAFCF